MKRHELEHIIRAAGAIAGVSEVVIIGSQAILGSFPDPPAELLVSQEADLFPYKEPEKADLIDGSIGELSPFHEAFGYYAHGISPETAVLPKNWEHRVAVIKNENTRSVAGLCIHPGDIAVSKLLAGRAKDVHYVALLLKHQLISKQDVEALASELAAEHALQVKERLARL